MRSDFGFQTDRNYSRCSDGTMRNRIRAAVFPNAKYQTAHSREQHRLQRKQEFVIALHSTYTERGDPSRESWPEVSNQTARFRKDQDSTIDSDRLQRGSNHPQSSKA